MLMATHPVPLNVRKQNHFHFQCVNGLRFALKVCMDSTGRTFYVNAI